MKQRIAVMLGLKQFRNAVITIAGIELMHRIRCASRSAAILYGSVLHAMLTPWIRRGSVGW